MQTWLDTHLHLLYPERLHYDWATGIAALSKPFHIEEYLALAQALRITATLHMEVDVRAEEIEKETELVDELARHTSGQIIGTISACRPETTDEEAFAGFCERAHANPSVRGFRRVLHTQPDDLSTSETFRKHVRALTRNGHVFELCVLPRQMPQAIALVSACPNTMFVLNHCGVPDIAGGELHPWKANLTRLAKHPNVSCKISGLISYGDPKRWPEGDLLAIADDLRPYFDAAIEAFNWHRVVWGSDFPVCNLTRGLIAWRQVTDILVQGASQSEVAALAELNARRIYRLKGRRTINTEPQQHPWPLPYCSERELIERPLSANRLGSAP